jgi:hypothetical protein
MIQNVTKLIRRVVGAQNLKEMTGKIQTILNAQLFRGAIENSEWLKYKSFAPGGWAMDNAALYSLFCILNNVRPKKILEFGLGQSSTMIHQYVAFSENSTALTIEHDKDWIAFFCSGIPNNVNVTVKHIDIETIKVNGHMTVCYKTMNYGGGGHDLIIVDGPFGSEHYSRPQIIDIVKKGLPKQFCIFMDDTERSGEKETMEALCGLLQTANIKFLMKNYIGEKNQHTIICSEDLKFLTTLR